MKKDRNAIIVGATSGIGRELAHQLTAEGYRVGIAGRRAELLDTLAAESPERYVTAVFDATSDDAPAALGSLIERLGGLDLFVYSSGTGYDNPDLDEPLEMETTAVNVDGFTRLVGHVYRYFEAHGGGHIVAITSVMGLRGSGNAPAYAATKAYQINYLEGLRQRSFKRKNGISVTDIRPGSVDTAMMKGEGHFWIAKPDRAARVIAKAIYVRKPVKYVTSRWQTIGTLLKILPRSLYNRMI